VPCGSALLLRYLRSKSRNEVFLVSRPQALSFGCPLDSLARRVVAIYLLTSAGSLVFEAQHCNASKAPARLRLSGSSFEARSEDLGGDTRRCSWIQGAISPGRQCSGEFERLSDLLYACSYVDVELDGSSRSPRLSRSFPGIGLLGTIPESSLRAAPSVLRHHRRAARRSAASTFSVLSSCSTCLRSTGLSRSTGSHCIERTPVSTVSMSGQRLVRHCRLRLPANPTVVQLDIASSRRCYVVWLPRVYLRLS
jgi:hypothetical protein